MPIAVLEALATGLPVISTRVGEVPSLIRDGMNGYLSEERTPASLALAIARGKQKLAGMRGAPCTAAVLPYQPQSVLKQIYDMHLAEVAQPVELRSQVA
jgi:glycosyltransferase involved in cell wall biosynthesis